MLYYPKTSTLQTSKIIFVLCCSIIYVSNQSMDIIKKVTRNLFIQPKGRSLENFDGTTGSEISLIWSLNHIHEDPYYKPVE